MIYYVSEDKSDSPFVKLFNAAYGYDVLRCAGRNTAIAKLILKLAKPGDKVIVYLDMVPDNDYLLSIYDLLM